MRRTFFAAVLALGTAASLMTAGTSSATDGQTTPPGLAKPTTLAEPAARQLAEQALDRARDLVSGTTGRTAGSRVDGTLALRELYASLPALDAAGRRQAGAILARPTAGSRDPYGDGYTVDAKRKCDGHFCLHWVPTTADAPPSRAWVRKNLATMNSVWRKEVGTLNYRRPLRDLQRGGNGKFDVYLKDVGSRGLYGYCAPERPKAGTPKFLATGYCVLDNDFSRDQFGAPPRDSLRVTAAHEFFHAVQFAYDAGEDGWFMETTATWMEERYADGVNDNRQFLTYGQLGNPASVLDIFAQGGFNQYGNWPFFEFLSSRHGNGIVRAIWNVAGAYEGAPDRYSSKAVKVVLEKHGGLPAVFAQYAGGNTVPGRTYDEGSHWPKAAISRNWTLSPDRPQRSRTFEIDHLASSNAKITPGSTLTGKRWRARISVDGPGQKADPAAYLIIQRASGRLTREALPLDDSGAGRTTVAFSNQRVRSVTITLANASTRFDCWVQAAYSCQGKPEDDNRNFALTVTAFRG